MIQSICIRGDGLDSKIYEELYKNTKTKIYPDGSVNTVYCDHPIFTDPQVKEKYSDEIAKHSDELRVFFEVASKLDSEELAQLENCSPAELAELFEPKSEQGREVEFEKRKPSAPRERSDSLKRSKDKVFDIVRLNDWKYFLTITFNGSEYDFKNPQFIKKKVRKWLENQVQRCGLKYILIPEYHEKGGIHCHALINDALEVVDSGTRIIAGYGKPVKVETVEKYHSEVLHVVYNVPKWKYGFSTAIEVTDSSGLAHYVTKYITKGNDKIFGKYYWAGGDIKREPQIVYTNTSFDSVQRPEHYKPYTSYVYKYASNFEVSNFDEVAERYDYDVSAMLEYLYSSEYRNEVD